MIFPIRINKYLRDRGLASRREADKIIASGLVLVNGQPAQTGMLVREKDRVVVNKEYHKEYIYLAYYKPRGLATQDHRGLPSVMENFKEKSLFPLGRLDKESEGLLILTNDGRITKNITGNNGEMEKEYIVEVRERLSPNIVNIFKKGMSTQALGKLLPAKVKIINDHALQVILREGKRHQIRVMLNELNYTVTALKRIRVGQIKLGNLKPEQTHPLTNEELNMLQ